MRREECLHSAALLPRLDGRTARAAEEPRGAVRLEADGWRGPSRANLALLETLLPGLLWPHALLTIASLDLDLAEAAVR